MSFKLPALPEIERRWTPGKVELRDAEGDKPSLIAGYGAVFGKRSENMGYGDVKFFEIIEPGAFDDVLSEDVRGLFNHDANLILGRTRSKTLRLFVDATGLGYEIIPPDTQYARDLQVSLKRGDVDQSSFAFSLRKDGQKWVEEGNVITRYIKKVSRLYDVSPVTYPAYPDAPASMRSIQALIEEARASGMLEKSDEPKPSVDDTDDMDRRRRELDLLHAEG